MLFIKMYVILCDQMHLRFSMMMWHVLILKIVNQKVYTKSLENLISLCLDWLIKDVIEIILGERWMSNKDLIFIFFFKLLCLE